MNKENKSQTDKNRRLVAYKHMEAFLRKWKQKPMAKICFALQHY